MRAKTRISQGLPKVRSLERPCLVQIHGPDLGRAVFLDGPFTTFGRALECDVAVEAESVSRRHCTIVACTDGVVARDDRSTNGTFVNDERVSGERLLAPGDLVRMGSVVFKLLTADRTSGVEAHYHDALYRLTVTDALTELYNRRYLLQFLEREIARATRHRRPLAVLLIDIDHFKDVNDRHGHLAGDFVLRELAAILRVRTRREECLARYGGEELCLVLPEATREDATRRGDELRRICESHEFVFDDARIPVTFSGGVAAMTAGMGPNDLVRTADERLYAAKRGGRNRICESAHEAIAPIGSHPWGASWRRRVRRRDEWVPPRADPTFVRDLLDSVRHCVGRVPGGVGEALDSQAMPWRLRSAHVLPDGDLPEVPDAGGTAVVGHTCATSDRHPFPASEVAALRAALIPSRSHEDPWPRHRAPIVRLRRSVCPRRCSNEPGRMAPSAGWHTFAPSRRLSKSTSSLDFLHRWRKRSNRTSRT